MPGAEHRGQEAAVTGIQCITREQRLALAKVAPDHRAQQLTANRFRVDAGASRDILLRPRFDREIVRLKQCPSPQRPRRNQQRQLAHSLDLRWSVRAASSGAG